MICYSPAEEEIKLRAYFCPAAGEINLTKQMYIRKSLWSNALTH
jgi:hypothetical protein